eukprot:363962-Chlamydomonas_euryale.AAC.3
MRPYMWRKTQCTICRRYHTFWNSPQVTSCQTSPRQPSHTLFGIPACPHFPHLDRVARKWVWHVHCFPCRLTQRAQLQPKAARKREVTAGNDKRLHDGGPARCRAAVGVVWYHLRARERRFALIGACTAWSSGVTCVLASGSWRCLVGARTKNTAVHDSVAWMLICGCASSWAQTWVARTLSVDGSKACLFAGWRTQLLLRIIAGYVPHGLCVTPLQLLQPYYNCFNRTTTAT